LCTSRSSCCSGALGAVVAVSTWGAQRLGVVRHRRRSRRAERDAVDAFRVGVAQQRDARMRHHRASVGTLHRAVATAAEPDSSLWARRRDHHDAFTVSLGIGDVSWQPVLSGDGAAVPPVCWGIVEQASTIPDATVPVDLAGGMSLAVCGPHAEPVAAALLAQLAVQAGPADWRLMIVTESRGAWAHWTSLPHSAGGAPTAGVLDEQDVADLLRDGRPDDERKLVVVVDEVRLLAARTSPVRRLLATAPTSTLIAVVADPATVPSLCTSLLVTSIDGRATWTCDTATGDLPRPLRLAGLARGDAASLVASLARFVDPEDPTAPADTLPTDVALASLLAHVDPDAIAASWAAAAPDTSPETVIGTAPDGVVTVDLVRDGPHALVAGTTGSGKSELLRSLVVGLAATLSPDHVTFVLFDYKGGAAFDACAPLPHVVGVVTDLDGRMTERALRSLRAELTRREHLLRDCGVADLTALRAEAGRPVVPRLVVVVDEFAAMAVEHADLLHALIGIAQRGRSLGVHLVLATQRPAGVVSDDIRANTNLRIALRLTDPTDSLDVVGDPAAAALSRQHRGRALMRLGPMS
jgi:S-DNA-T family DNA segregation ATPase FtsK/SpoIIIE